MEMSFRWFVLFLFCFLSTVRLEVTHHPLVCDWGQEESAGSLKLTALQCFLGVHSVTLCGRLLSHAGAELYRLSQIHLRCCLSKPPPQVRGVSAKRTWNRAASCWSWENRWLCQSWGETTVGMLFCKHLCSLFTPLTIITGYYWWLFFVIKTWDAYPY